jgi:hypothetical protein
VATGKSLRGIHNMPALVVDLRFPLIVIQKKVYEVLFHAENVLFNPPPLLLEMFIIMTVGEVAVDMEKIFGKSTMLFCCLFMILPPPLPPLLASLGDTQTCHMDGRKTKREAKSRAPLLAWRVESKKTTAKNRGPLEIYSRYGALVGLNNPDVRY